MNSRIASWSDDNVPLHTILREEGRIAATSLEQYLAAISTVQKRKSVWDFNVWRRHEEAHSSEEKCFLHGLAKGDGGIHSSNRQHLVVDAHSTGFGHNLHRYVNTAWLRPLLQDSHTPPSATRRSNCNRWRDYLPQTAHKETSRRASSVSGSRSSTHETPLISPTWY